MLNCFLMSAEPNINVDLKGNKKRSNSNVPEAYKSEFSHIKLSWISWSKTTLIILALLLWPTVYIPHNNVLNSSATTEMETSMLEALVVTLTPGNRDTSVWPLFRTCKDMWHSTQRPFCNLVHQRKIYCLLVLLNFSCFILILKGIHVHDRKIKNFR